MDESTLERDPNEGPHDYETLGDLVSWTYQANAYFENKEETVVRCIRVGTFQFGKKSEQCSINKEHEDGEGGEWPKLFDIVSVEEVRKNTKERLNRKKAEHETNRYKEQQKAHAKKLENLFAMKLEAFEIPTIRDSKNTKLRSKIRRSINQLEVQANVTILLLEEYRKLSSE
ncbi:hypothetical protein OAA26_00110 [bacterium]|nr:hypothetical protein [bacterium]